MAAALNAVVQHLAAETTVGADPEEELAEDYAEDVDATDAEVPDVPEDSGQEDGS